MKNLGQLLVSFLCIEEWWLISIVRFSIASCKVTWPVRNFFTASLMSTPACNTPATHCMRIVLHFPSLQLSNSEDFDYKARKMLSATYMHAIWNLTSGLFSFFAVQCSSALLPPSYHSLLRSAQYWEIKGITAKMWLSLSYSGHTLVMESLKLGPRVNALKEENDSNNLTLGPSWGESITQVWPEYERLSHIFAVTPLYTAFSPQNWKIYHIFQVGPK